MKRADLKLDVLYAIGPPSAGSWSEPRPGLVKALEPYRLRDSRWSREIVPALNRDGTPDNKAGVLVSKSPRASADQDRSKYVDDVVPLSHILKPWAEYLAEKQAAEAAAKEAQERREKEVYAPNRALLAKVEAAAAERGVDLALLEYQRRELIEGKAGVKFGLERLAKLLGVEEG